MADFFNSFLNFFHMIGNTIYGFFHGIFAFNQFKDVLLGFFRGGVAPMPAFLVPFLGLSLAVLVVKLILDLL